VGPLFLVFLLTPGFLAAEPRAANPRSFFPDMLLCGQNPSGLGLVTGSGKGEWTYPVDGPVFDAQSEPSGDWLVAGGKGKVFLLHHTFGKKPWISAWDWSALDTAPPVSAVAVDWDLNGRPTLVLAADAVKNRIFLADAKEEAPKMRWEFTLPFPPRSARVCPDSGNFLVTMDSSVEEVDFQQAKVLWTLGSSAGVTQATDAARSPDSNTFVIDGLGRVSAYDVDQHLLWQTFLDPSASQWKNTTLSLFEAREEIRLLVSGEAKTGRGRESQVWVLDSKNGKILASGDPVQKSSASSILRAVPQIEGMDLMKK
jgi:hypothetical protein